MPLATQPDKFDALADAVRKLRREIKARWETHNWAAYDESTSIGARQTNADAALAIAADCDRVDRLMAEHGIEQ